MSKTIGEIIDQCLDGELPRIHDARLTICALNSLLVFNSQDLKAIVRIIEKFNAPKKTNELISLRISENSNRTDSAFDTTPSNWLGKENNPDGEGVQKRRRILKTLFKDLTKKEQKT